MTLEHKTSIEWYESQLSDEDILEARKKHISELEAGDISTDYLCNLIIGYRKKLEEKYHVNFERSGK